LKDYNDVPDAIDNLARYFPFYNVERPHQALNYQTPEAVFYGVNMARRFFSPARKSERMPLRGGSS
jgi:transposase InsO family protein